MSDDALHASFRGATLDAIVQGSGTARLDCTLRSGERIAVHLEGVMLFRAQGEGERNLIGSIRIGRGREVRGLARDAFAPKGGNDQPWLKGVAKRALLGQLSYFSLTPRIGPAVASLCQRVVLLPMSAESADEAADIPCAIAAEKAA